MSDEQVAGLRWAVGLLLMALASGVGFLAHKLVDGQVDMRERLATLEERSHHHNDNVRVLSELGGR